MTNFGYLYSPFASVLNYKLLLSQFDVLKLKFRQKESHWLILPLGRDLQSFEMRYP
jgi:hypothetical protein